MTTDVPLDTDSRRLRTAIPPVAHPEWDRRGQGEAINRRRQCSDRTASLRYINFRHRARQQVQGAKDSRAPYLVPVKALPPGRPKPADLDRSSTAGKMAYLRLGCGEVADDVCPAAAGNGVGGGSITCAGTHTSAAIARSSLRRWPSRTPSLSRS